MTKMFNVFGLARERLCEAGGATVAPPGDSDKWERSQAKVV